MPKSKNEDSTAYTDEDTAHYDLVDFMITGRLRVVTDIKLKDPTADNN